MGQTPIVSRRSILQAAVAAGLCVPAVAGAEKPGGGAELPPAKPEDVTTLDAILAALYDVISGPKGQARDWDRLRALFAPGARLMPCLPKNAEGKVEVRVLSVDDYVARATPMIEKTGFFEREVSRKVERFGHITHVFSTYESRREKEAAPFSRGINSIQLLWDGARWWVVTILWDAEAPDQPIPEQYLPKG